MKQSTAVAISKSFKPPPTPGKHYRLLCMTGDYKGTSYYLKENRVVLGRSEDADVQLADVKASREHAELTRFKDTFIVTDLGSQNGIIVNDLKVAQHTLTNGDKIIIGQTVFKFDVIDVRDLIQEIKNNPLGKPAKGENEKEQAVAPKKKPSKLLMLGGVAIFVIFIMLDSGDNGPAVKKEDTDKKMQDISDNYTAQLMKKKEVEDKDLQKKLDAIIQRGQREYREKNFFRAIEEFNLALVLNPNNGRAAFYLNKTKQSLDNSIEDLFLKARRDFDSLRYQSAGLTYCSIMRILEAYKDDERFKRAEGQLRNVEKELGMIEGEYKCFEE
ncbi:MAG: FHA domain-containing protein [Bdellovibrio sp.]|nr:FHA domain-containing protein [Bdellovibrio sp.]